MWPFSNPKMRINLDHPMWREGATTQGMAENIGFSSNFNSPADIIFTTTADGNLYVSDPFTLLFRISSHAYERGHPQGPDTVLHCGIRSDDPAHGFIKSNRDGTNVRQVIGIRTASEFADFSVPPRYSPNEGFWQTPHHSFSYKHVPIESRLKSWLFRTRQHSFRVRIPGTGGLKEIFIWKETCGTQMRNFKYSISKSCNRQWKLVRAATNEVVALYMSDWTKSDVNQQGHLRFCRDVVDLGSEFDLLATMSVLAVLRNPRL